MQPTLDTVEQLRASGYASRSIRDEMRSNLVQMLRAGISPFPNLHGYEDTVIPQVENAILAGHDVLLLGERGQAKSRLARGLTALLDEWIPIISGTETNDDPFHPASALGRARIAEFGDQTPISWIHRSHRFAEKLATPDTSIADLIGEVDPIKIAEGRYLSNEEVISYGLIPRANRGVFNLNELPDLSERIQVGLLNILEERDVQIRGFTVRMPLDIMVVASANPEDYTNRGRIITPLKDRFGSQVRTHYPQSLDQELRIVDQEQESATISGIEVIVPEFTRQLVAAITHEARKHPKVNARSGVSVRMTIANYEVLIANAQRRATLAGEKVAVPGVIDLPALGPAMSGKIEFDTWEAQDDLRVVDDILSESVRRAGQSVAQLDWAQSLLDLVEHGQEMSFDPLQTSEECFSNLRLSDDILSAMTSSIGSGEPAFVLAWAHFTLEYWFRMGRLRKSPHGYSAI